MNAELLNRATKARGVWVYGVNNRSLESVWFPDMDTAEKECRDIKEIMTPVLGQCVIGTQNCLSFLWLPDVGEFNPIPPTVLHVAYGAPRLLNLYLYLYSYPIQQQQEFWERYHAQPLDPIQEIFDMWQAL